MGENGADTVKHMTFWMKMSLWNFQHTQWRYTRNNFVALTDKPEDYGTIDL